MTTTVRAVPGFLPSSAGFHFANRWPRGPALVLGARVPGPVPLTFTLGIGDAAYGLCGGMALAVLDLWASGVVPPPDREPPAAGSPLFRAIVRRQVDSLEWGLAVWRFYRAAAAAPQGRARLTVRDTWPAVRRAIDAGRPTAVGLIHVASADPRALGANHQVVVHGYELDAVAGHVTLSVYDPNHPDDDTIRLGITLAGPRGPVAFSYLDREAPVLGLVPLRSTRGRHRDGSG
jgi:hypothetical protein